MVCIVSPTPTGYQSFNSFWLEWEAVDVAPQPPKDDPVNHPTHYTAHPSGVECIQITEHMNFTLGDAVKYIWRADMKNGVEDLKKAAWYIEREIQRRSK